MKNDWWYSREAEGEKKMEFDKSRVYTSLNADELKAGDKVIVADTIAELKRIITGEIYCIAHIMRVNDEDCENRFCIGESDATGDITYPLAYLVERAENCTMCDRYCTNTCAYVKGKDPKCTICYEDFIPTLSYLSSTKTTEKKYRPFKNVDELIDTWLVKSGMRKEDGFTYGLNALSEPLIWVQVKKNGRRFALAELDERILGYLFSDCTFLDGSTCGVEE